MDFKNIAVGWLNLAKSELGVANEEVEKVAVWRYIKCLQCDKQNKEDKTCTICGCYMPAKVRAPDVTCPIGRW